MLRNRWDRPVKNGYWFLADGQGLRPVGWGDLSVGDLEAVAAHIGGDDTFVVVPERRRDDVLAAGGAETASLDPASLAAHAVYAVTTGTVWLVDRFGEANRRGAVWIRPGHRLTRTGRIVRAAPRRLLAITPGELHRRLTADANPSSTPPGADPASNATCPTADVVDEPTATPKRSRSCQHPSGCS